MGIHHQAMRCGGFHDFLEVIHHKLAVVPFFLIEQRADITQFHRMNAELLVIFHTILHLCFVVSHTGSSFVVTNDLHAFGFGIAGDFLHIQPFDWFGKAKSRRTLPPIPFPALVPTLNQHAIDIMLTGKIDILLGTGCGCPLLGAW